MDLSMLLAFIPEPWRTYVVAVLFAFLATQVVSSAVVAVLPASAFKWRPLRALSWYAHLAPRDAAGTFKLPFRAPLQPGAMEDLARLQRAVEALQRDAAPLAAPRETQAPPPPPPSGQSGRASIGALLVLLVVGLSVAATHCGPVREGVMRITPGVPDPSGCAEGAQRCNGAVPEVCSETHRWWPALPLRADGTQRSCAGGCAVGDAGVAACLAVDGGTR